jgi:streptogramin lyase
MRTFFNRAPLAALPYQVWSRLGALLFSLSAITTPCYAQTREPLLLERGESLPLPSGHTVPVRAGERAITAVAIGHDGQIWAATTGAKAHLYAYDPATRKSTGHVAGMDVGVGMSHGMALTRDGSVIWGTQRDPTGLAREPNPAWLGRMQQYWIEEGRGVNGVKGQPIKGQGVYTLANLPSTNELVGLTWPDGHFFSQEAKDQDKATDQGPIAGYRIYETPRYAEKINQGTGRKLSYARQVSRVIAVDPLTGAYTAGEGGFLYHYDPQQKKLNKLKLRLPAAAGREAFASWDAAAVLLSTADRQYTSIFGGTSDGYVFELRIRGPDQHELLSYGKPFSEPGIYGLVARETQDAQSQPTITIDGLAGHPDGITRAFRIVRGPDRFEMLPGGPPVVDGQTSMEPFSNLVLDADGNVYGGELCRIGRLVKFSAAPTAPKPKAPAKKAAAPHSPAAEKLLAEARPLPCRIVFAPDGTTTEASGYTAIETGRDGHIYVGSARYGDYAYLLRLPALHALRKVGYPSELPTFMEKAVYLRDLVGEHREGLNTQGKIHAKIAVASDGKVYFATKQAHEVFGTRPEYEDPLGYPGGYLCVYDPATKQARSLGILKHREGLMGGVLDEARGQLYFRSEPKNHFLVYDLASGKTRDLGNVGAACRYMALDKHGAVWIFGRGQTICRYDPKSQLLDDVPIEIEGDGDYTEPYVVLLGPDGKLYGLRGGHDSVMQFDIDQYDATAKKPRVVLHNIAPASLLGMPVLDIHAAAFGQDGKLYWPLVTAEPSKAANRAARVLVIMRYDPVTKQTELVGKPQIEGLDEDHVRHTYIREDKYNLDHMQGACVGPDGSLYLMDIYPQLNVACFPQLTK